MLKLAFLCSSFLLVPSLSFAGTGSCTAEKPALLGPEQLVWSTDTKEATVFMKGGPQQVISYKGTIQRTWKEFNGYTTLNFSFPHPRPVKGVGWDYSELTLVMAGPKTAYMHYARFQTVDGKRAIYRVFQPTWVACNIEKS